MGIRLTLALLAPANAVRSATPVERLSRERPEAEAPERDDSHEVLEVEREREGDYEPVSLPQFLKSLRGVAASAEQRRDDLPAHVRNTTLPTLRGLLGQAKASSSNAASAVAVLSRPPPVPAARSRLMASTGALGVPPPRPASPGRRPSG